MKQIKIFQIFICISILIYTFITSCVMAKSKAKWTFATSGQIWSSPTISDSIIYIGSDDYNLYALYSNSGILKWKFATGGLIRCKPAVVDGTVYFVSDDGNLYAADIISGTEKWHCDIGNKIVRKLPAPGGSGTGETWDYMQSSPTFNQGTVYVGSGDSSVYAIDAQNGTLKWKTKTGGIVRSTPFVEDTVVYVGSFDGFIYALSTNTGSLIWRFNTTGQTYQAVQPSPRVVNGIVYCGSRSAFFYALNASTGQELWKYDYQGSWVESSAIIVNGVVYVGSSDLRTVFAFDAQTGRKLWERAVTGYPWSTPAYDNGTIYIGTSNTNTAGQTPKLGYLYALNATTGKEYWNKPTRVTEYLTGVVSSPIVSNGTVYFGGLDSLVYAVSSDPTPYVNKALGKKASASSCSPSTCLPDKAIDGDQDTRWISEASDPQWLMVDLGLVDTISRVFLRMSNVNVKEFEIQTSLDSINWTTNFIGNASILNDDLVFTPVFARYVRIFGTQRMTSRMGYYIDEIEIYSDQQETSAVNTHQQQINSFALKQNYPNPFNPSTNISFILQKRGMVTLAVFDILGREIITITKKEHAPGLHTYTFDASKLSSGVYFYRIATSEKTAIKKMMLTK